MSSEETSPYCPSEIASSISRSGHEHEALPGAYCPLCGECDVALITGTDKYGNVRSLMWAE